MRDSGGRLRRVNSRRPPSIPEYPTWARKLRRELLKSLSRVLRLPPASARFEGLALQIPLIFGLGADHLTRTAQPWTYRLLARLLAARPGALVDIGANVGLYLIWLKSIDADRQYVGFEPNPACYFYLQELIRHNRFAGACVLPEALSDKRALRTFFVRRLGDKMGSLLGSHRVEKDRPFSFDVMTQPGDPLFEALDLPAIGAMKVDVEGAELEVLRGLAGTLSRYRPPIICEVLPLDPDRSDNGERRLKINALLSLAAELDYRMLSMGADGQLSAVSEADNLVLGSEPDRLMVPSSDLDHMVALGSGTRVAPG